MYCYDYGARFYDAQLGRFHTQDKFAEKYHTVSPYQYGLNNPIKYIDENGDFIVDMNGNVVTITWDTKGRIQYGFSSKYNDEELKDVKEQFMANGGKILNAMSKLPPPEEVALVIDCAKSATQNMIIPMSQFIFCKVLLQI